jgi:hypothetical protein
MPVDVTHLLTPFLWAAIAILALGVATFAVLRR